ncbi:MAG: glycosyltransferase family 4 protein [Acidimicrobiia bacterium]|nr:glycosyltransferase family 4 protein [Acidimicrobiia bacterium]
MTDRIGVNLVWMVPGVVGGSEEYAVRTLEAVLDREPADLDFVVFALESFRAAHPEICARIPVATVGIGGGSRPTRIAAENSWLAYQARRHGVSVMHHVGGRSPAVRRAPTLVTVHDLQPLVYPEHFGPVKARYLRYAIPRSVASARVVIAPSEYVRGQLIERYDLPPERVVAVSAGYEVPRLPAVGDPMLGDAVADLLGRAEPYVVYPAVTHPHKDHATVLRAVAQVAASGRPVRLVLTGAAGAADGDVDQLVAELNLSDRVVRLGRIERSVLDLVISRAEALVFPSRFEGFGIPVLEAMALGCPVIAADATAVPEVVGGAGILLPPGDVDAWASALIDRLDGRPPREDAAAAGRNQAARFARARSGERLEGAYRLALVDPEQRRSAS